jgi:hypothetical protein
MRFLERSISGRLLRTLPTGSLEALSSPSADDEDEDDDEEDNGSGLEAERSAARG